jgi:hypothetical protein|tara:strand:- start:13318 stop:13746 length:429 start_codon:yes stop_codon:yes gene_type:complete
MNLEELQTQAEKDLKIDDTELDRESLATPILHAKYLKHFSTYSLMLTKAKSEYSQLYKSKWLFYLGKAEPEAYKDNNFELKVLRQDVGTFIDADTDIIKQKQKVDYLNVVNSYLENILKQISNRGFQIKNAIDWKKFTEGGI